jgi:muconate cycloisomerase
MSPRVQYSGVITAMTPVGQMRAALKQRLYGFRQCKIKLGVRGMDDVEALRRARRILGGRVDVRVDANAAWTCAELPTKLEQLMPFGVSAVEQPVPHADVACLAEVRKQAAVPIMLDESLCGLTDAQRAIDEGLCDLFNIRLSKCGGFVNSLALAAMAHAAGLGYQLGCQVGETGILSAAGRHFATSVGGLRYLEGSYDRHLVAERLTVEDLTFGYSGVAPALTGPGLGVTVDRAALARCTVRRLLLMER